MKFLKQLAPVIIFLNAGLISPAFAQTLLVGNKNEGTVSFIDLATGKEVRRVDTGKAPHEIAISPDGKTAVVVSYRRRGFEGDTLHVFDVTTGEKTGVIDLSPHKAPHGLKWIADTDLVIATTEATQSVVIADIEKGELVGAVQTDQEGSHMVALSPDMKTAYAANIGSGSFTVIDLETLTKRRDVKAGKGTEAITVSPDGREIWVGNNNSRNVMVFSAEDFEKKATIDVKGIPIRVEMNPAGDKVAVSLADKHAIVVFDVATRTEVARIGLFGRMALVPVTMLFSEDGAALWAAATFSKKVVEIDTSDWSIARTFKAGDGSDGLGFSPLMVSNAALPNADMSK